MTRFAASRPVLQWAVERSGRDTTVLFKRLPKLSEWLRGGAQPTLRQLEALAKATSTPLGYLFLREPPPEELSIPHFRTVAQGQPTRPSPDLLETVQTMERRQEWMRQYLVEQGHEPLPFIRSASQDDEPSRVAAEIRRVLDVDRGWAGEQPNWSEALKELQSKIETASILVVVNGIVGNNTHRRLNVEEFRGFVLVDEYAPLIFVNGADAKAAQMFTLAHELAHLWLGSSAAFDLRELEPANDATERKCNRIAAEFLIPEEELRAYWNTHVGATNEFADIARQFKVSELVAARRVLDLRLISQAKFHDFYRSYLVDVQRRESVRASGGNFYATQSLRIGRRFAETVVRAAREGRLLYRSAYQLTGLSGRAFDRFSDSLTLEGRR